MPGGWSSVHRPLGIDGHSAISPHGDSPPAHSPALSPALTHPERGHSVPQPLGHLLAVPPNQRPSWGASPRRLRGHPADSARGGPGRTSALRGAAPTLAPPPSALPSAAGAGHTLVDLGGAEGRESPCGQTSPLACAAAAAASRRGRGARPRRPAGRQLLPPGGHPPTAGTQSPLGALGARLRTPVPPRAARRLRVGRRAAPGPRVRKLRASNRGGRGRGGEEAEWGGEEGAGVGTGRGVEEEA